MNTVRRWLTSLATQRTEVRLSSNIESETWDKSCKEVESVSLAETLRRHHRVSEIHLMFQLRLHCSFYERILAPIFRVSAVAFIHST